MRLALRLFALVATLRMWIVAVLGTGAAAARGLLSQGGGARVRRRTDLARRPHGAAVARAGVGRRWPHELLGEPAPRAGGVLLLLLTTSSRSAWGMEPAAEDHGLRIVRVLRLSHIEIADDDGFAEMILGTAR